MRPQTWERGPANNEAPPEKISHRHGADRDQPTATDRQPVNVPALAFHPAGRRRGWLWLVEHCPYCGGYAHAHRGGPVGGVRRAGCDRGDYRLVRTGRGWAA